MTEYTVLATELHQQTSAVWEHGMLRVELKKYRRGDTVSDLSADDVERHLASGAIAAKSSDEAKVAAEFPTTAPPIVAPVPPDVPVAGAAVIDDERSDQRPKQTAPKSDWQAFRIASGWTEEEAEAATKAELVDGTK